MEISMVLLLELEEADECSEQYADEITQELAVDLPNARDVVDQIIDDKIYFWEVR